MEEEISLREIIETIWNGKMIIAAITAAAMLVAGIASFVVMAPAYEAQSIVRIENQPKSEGAPPQDLNYFVESIKSDVAMKRIIDKLNLSQEKYTINSVRNSIATELVKGTNVVRVTVKGTDPKAITNMANLMAFELGARTEISDRSVQIVDLKNRLLDLDDQIAMTQSDLAESQKQLSGTPEKLVTRKALADEPYLQSVAEETGNGSNRQLGSLELITEEINPLYTSLTSRISDLTITLTRLQEEKKAKEATIAKNQDRINELDRQMNSEKLSAQNSERLLNGFNAVFISPAIEPVDPVGPKKLLNVAIAAVLGVMLSVMIVFVKHYWITSGRPVQQGISESI